MSKPLRAILFAVVVIVAFTLLELAVNAMLWDGNAAHFGAEDGGVDSSTIFSWAKWLIALLGAAYIARTALARNRKAIAFSTVSFIVVLALIEVVVVATGIFQDPEHATLHKRFYQQYEPDADLGFRLQSNIDQLDLSDPVRGVEGIISTDAKGFRNIGHEYSDVDALFFGDSFCFGAWVSREDSFYGVIEASHPELKMLNLGVGGYAMEQYDFLARKWVPELKPEQVVVCLFANDLGRLRDSHFFKNYYEFSGAVDYTEPTPPWYETTFTAKIINTLEAALAPKNDFGGSATMANGLLIFKQRGVHGAYFDDGLNVALEQKVADLIAFNKKHGAETLLVLIPSKESAHPDEYKRLFPDNTDYFDIEENGYQSLCEVAIENGAECIDLTATFREACKTEQLYFEIDGHFNPAGHRVAAREIAKHLQS